MTTHTSSNLTEDDLASLKKKGWPFDLSCPLFQTTFESIVIDPSYVLPHTNGDIHSLPVPSNLGVVGDKGPEGEQGPTGHVHEEAGPGEIPEGVLKEAEAKAEGKGTSLQDIIDSKKVAATEMGGVVLMPQEFDADNVKAYIQQEIEAGIKEHQTELMRKVADVLAEEMRKVADVLAEEITKVKNTQKAREDQQERWIAHSFEGHKQGVAAVDKERALAISELWLKIEELEARLEEKSQETKLLRKRLHAASMGKPVRKIRKVNSVINTPESKSD